MSAAANDPGPPLEVNVRTGVLKSVVSFRSKGAHLLALQIPRWEYWRKQRLQLSSTRLGKQLSQYAGIREVVRALGEHVRLDDTSLAITGDGLADLLPWEAFEPSFILPTTQERYTPVRLVGPPAPAGDPLRFPDGMRLLCLIGHEGPTADFNRAAIEQELRRSLDGLDVESRQRFESVLILDLTLGNLAQHLRDSGARDPHVVLYFGHGRARGAGQIRVGPNQNDWQPIEQLVAELRTVFAMPPFWIFVACSIGEQRVKDSLLPGPPAFTALAAQGAIALLAMRSQIRPLLAPILVRSVIERLAAGASLEAAAATARRAARSVDPHPGQWDWAAPAVWSTTYGGMRTVWREDQDLLTGSDWWIGLRLLRQDSQDPTLGLQVPPPWALEQAEFWRRQPRIRLVLPRAAGPDSKQAITQVATILAAVRRLSGATVLFIVPPDTGPYSKRLSQWAAALLSALPPSQTGGPVAQALRRLADHDLEGLNQLLHLPEFLVVFLQAPGLTPADRAVWHEIASAPPATRVVVCESADEQNEASQNWSTVRLGQEMRLPSVERLLRLQPRTAGLLAVLTKPVHLPVLAQVTGEPQLEDAADILVPASASGFFLADDAREHLRTLLGPERLQQAHEAYVVARFERDVHFALDDPFTDLFHLCGAGRLREVARSVSELAEFNGGLWQEADWIRLADTLDTDARTLRDIDPEVSLYIAALFVRRQELQRAAGWLDLMARTATPVQHARRALLQSEVWKSQPGSGAKTAMWNEARSALALASSVPPVSPDAARAAEVAREARLQIARLQLYFNHNALTARVIFEQIIAESLDAAQTNPTVARVLIAAQRNLGECLFEFAPFADQPLLQQLARDTLLQALGRARALGELQLAADVAYSLAKLDETQRDYGAALRQLELCAALALESKYYLALRLAELRQFWIGVQRLERPFEWLSFRARQNPIDYLSWHAWARRYGAQSRLWAAARLAPAERTPEAVQLLQDNLATLGERYDMESNSDRNTLTRTYAGLAVLQSDSPHWTHFLQLPWAEDWLQTLATPTHPEPTPASLWQGVS